MSSRETWKSLTFGLSILLDETSSHLHRYLSLNFPLQCQESEFRFFYAAQGGFRWNVHKPKNSENTIVGHSGSVKTLQLPKVIQIAAFQNKALWGRGQQSGAVPNIFNSARPEPKARQCTKFHYYTTKLVACKLKIRKQDGQTVKQDQINWE